MAISYIKATTSNLDMGRIVIQCTPEGVPFGPLMICANRKNWIKKNPVITCYIHTNEPFELGKELIEFKNIHISKLARVIDHFTKRKLKPEEKFYLHS